MTETRVIMACAERQVHWYLGVEPARCTDPGHQHRQVEVHRHRSVVTLPDGTKVTAVSFDAVAPYARDRQPGYGLYLDRRWQPPWPHDHLDWPDFGVPGDPASVLIALKSVIDRARTGEQVEVGCLGGHGRTGTALACLAVLTGHPATDAVAWVRARYCPEAVETAGQEAFVLTLARCWRSPSTPAALPGPELQRPDNSRTLATHRSTRPCGRCAPHPRSYLH